ncbi:hypothetical protein [Dyella sp.]|uniref:hypothetical protein n=1 Tax=Dyella sp. TaxID=1869338 RepID=UPI002FDA722C
MKPSLKVVIVAFIAALASPLALAATPEASATAPAQHAAASPLLGSWSLDTSRMRMPPGQRPKSVIFTFGNAGGNKWDMRVDIVYAPGNEVHSSGAAALDGTPSVVKNSPEADTAAMELPSPDVLVMALLKNGVLVSTRIYAVLPDKHSLVETAVYPGKDGVPVMKTNYFIRVHQGG